MDMQSLSLRDGEEVDGKRTYQASLGGIVTKVKHGRSTPVAVSHLLGVLLEISQLGDGYGLHVFYCRCRKGVRLRVVPRRNRTNAGIKRARHS